MRFRISPICGLAVAAIVVATTVRSSAQTQISSLRAEGKGIALIVTAVPIRGCIFMHAQLSHATNGGRHIADNEIYLANFVDRGIFKEDRQPTILRLPPGRYGIVRLSCSQANRFYLFAAKMAETRNILTGTGNIYERPIIEFTVRLGEVANVGMLQIHSTSRKTFSASVGRIPEIFMQGLAERSPEYSKAKISRPMTRPAGAKI
jgi:hypothetical protein